MERNINGRKKHTIPLLLRVATGGCRRRRNSRSMGAAIGDVATVLDIENN